MCMKEKGRATQMKTAKKREKYILASAFNLDCNYDGVFFPFLSAIHFHILFPSFYSAYC